MIRSVHLENFLHLSPLNWDTPSSINLIIGENDTGKTSILKLIYAAVRSWKIHTHNLEQDRKVAFRDVLSSKLYNTFQPRKGGLGNMVSKGSNGRLKAEITLFGDAHSEQEIAFSFTQRTESKVTDETTELKPCPIPGFQPIFLPTKEVLSSWQAIMSTRNESKWQFGFDDTYLDLIEALLHIGTPQQHNDEGFRKTKLELERLFRGGSIRQTQNPRETFLFKRGNASFSMAFTAEGVKKLGIFSTLIDNGNISSGTVLFLDEPEASLHPRAVRTLARIIWEFSKYGIQIFVSTHSYFLLKQLELLARKHKVSVGCCSLNHNAEGFVEAEYSDIQHGLPDNPIISEALELLDQEIELNMD